MDVNLLLLNGEDYVIDRITRSDHLYFRLLAPLFQRNVRTNWKG